MAKIKDRMGESSGGYARLLGDDKLGDLISRTHAASISAGSELERIITKNVKKIEDLDTFLRQNIMQMGAMLAVKQQIKKSAVLETLNFEPDFLIFKRIGEEQTCHVVELKDGHLFDTKKASAELHAIHSFVEKNGKHIPHRVSSHVCCFNQDDKDKIVKGLKNKISKDEAMTGRELCALLDISYDDIVNRRKEDQQYNKQTFLAELVKIDQCRIKLQELLKIR